MFNPLKQLKMNKTLELIPVMKRGVILYYIERKPNDFRPSFVIVREHLLNKKLSQLNIKLKEKKLNF